MSRLLPLAAVSAFGAAPALSQFAEVPAFTSGSQGYSENADFGDVDLDGDWDLAIADGGDFGNLLNQLQINQGGLQGGALGLFVDEAATRFPSQPDDSRDVEFADIDGDGDLDLHVVNTSTIVNQSNRWWINQGGAQGGALGFFADDTQARWVGLGEPGSSIWPSLVLPSGGFLNWNEDADFADLDNDGDLDLVNSSYGGAYGGQVPSRLFLNDGDGFFTEFNPSGHQLTTANIADGEPALWAEGIQATNTTDVTGAEADIASAVTDIEVGDLDGDFDLDLIFGHRPGLARLFGNFSDELGELSFRDVSNAAFPANWSVGGGTQFDQELIDLDGDGDLDLYGLNWNQFQDRTFMNEGGSYTLGQDAVPGSNADDEEADAIDFDNDGDLDVFVANFAGTDNLFANDGAGFLTEVDPAGLQSGFPSKDGEVADVDGDGDYDIFVAESESLLAGNRLYSNVTQIADVTPPYIPRVESLSDASASAEPRVQRAQVYDNTPYYLTWRNSTAVELSVDGIALGELTARTSYGQIFRAELPGNLVGQVEALWRSEDPHGNVGTAVPELWTATPGAATLPFAYGTGSANASGVTPTLSALSMPFPGSTLFLVGEGTPSTPALLVIADLALPATPIPGLGTLNVGGNVLLLLQGNTDASGRFLASVGVPADLVPGGAVFAQFGTFDGAGIDLLATSAGLEVVVQ
ncbi:MAG: FG-GAP repeat domain-containing protein [Planctomycetota bacterium]